MCCKGMQTFAGTLGRVDTKNITVALASGWKA